MEYIDEKTGLSLDALNDKVFALFSKSSVLLKNKFQEAKEKRELGHFFANAFDKEDNDFMHLYNRLFKYNAAEDAEAPPVIEEAQNDEIKEEFIVDVHATFFEKCQKFIDIQLHKYIEAINDRNEGDWNEIKERYILNPVFRGEYANDVNFRDYILNDAKVIGKDSAFGEITEEYVDIIIKDFIDQEILEKKIERINPFFGNFMGLRLGNNVPVKPIEELFEKNKENELTEPYKVILADLRKNGNNNDSRATIEACYKLSVFQKEILQDIEKNNRCDFVGLIGLYLHKENPKEETKSFVLRAPKILLEAYETHKKQKKLNQFFDVLEKSSRNACLEGRMTDLQEHMLKNHKSMLKNVDLKELLAPPLNPLVNKKENKEQNIIRFLEAFIEVQARKYAKDKNIPIDIKWLDENPKVNTKQIIKNEDEFEKYKTASLFLAFLTKDVNILGEKAITSEGKYTEEEIKKFVNDFVVAYALEKDKEKVEADAGA